MAVVSQQAFLYILFANPEFQQKINWQQRMMKMSTMDINLASLSCNQWLGKDDQKYTYCKSQLCTCKETEHYPACQPGQVDFVTEEVCPMIQDFSYPSTKGEENLFSDSSDRDEWFDDDDPWIKHSGSLKNNLPGNCSYVFRRSEFPF